MISTTYKFNTGLLTELYLILSDTRIFNVMITLFSDFKYQEYPNPTQDEYFKFFPGGI